MIASLPLTRLFLPEAAEIYNLFALLFFSLDLKLLNLFLNSFINKTKNPQKGALIPQYL